LRGLKRRALAERVERHLLGRRAKCITLGAREGGRVEADARGRHERRWRKRRRQTCVRVGECSGELKENVETKTKRSIKITIVIETRLHWRARRRPTRVSEWAALAETPICADGDRELPDPLPRNQNRSRTVPVPGDRSRWKADSSCASSGSAGWRRTTRRHRPETRAHPRQQTQPQCRTCRAQQMKMTTSAPTTSPCAGETSRRPMHPTRAARAAATTRTPSCSTLTANSGAAGTATRVCGGETTRARSPRHPLRTASAVATLTPRHPMMTMKTSSAMPASCGGATRRTTPTRRTRRSVAAK
jgi:hypothetical protein